MDEAQFEIFYRKTAGRIWSCIYRMTGKAAILASATMMLAFFTVLAEE